MTTEEPENLALIDREALRRLLKVVGNDPDELAELVGDYLEDAPELASRIVEAADNGDRDAFRISAHTLKSNARDFGAVRLSELCAAAEAASISTADVTDLAAAASDIALAEKAVRRALATVSLVGLERSLDTE